MLNIYLRYTCLIALVSGEETCFNNCSKLDKYCCCYSIFLYLFLYIIYSFDNLVNYNKNNNVN